MAVFFLEKYPRTWSCIKKFPGSFYGVLRVLRVFNEGALKHYVSMFGRRVVGLTRTAYIADLVKLGGGGSRGYMILYKI